MRVESNFSRWTSLDSNFSKGRWWSYFKNFWGVERKSYNFIFWRRVHWTLVAKQGSQFKFRTSLCIFGSHFILSVFFTCNNILKRVPGEHWTPQKKDRLMRTTNMGSLKIEQVPERFWTPILSKIRCSMISDSLPWEWYRPYSVRGREIERVNQ